MVRVHDIMTLDPVVISPEATLREAAEEMSTEHVTGLPVVQGGRVVGVISSTDIVEFGATALGTGAARAGRRGEVPGEGVEIWQEGDEPIPRYFVEVMEEHEDPEVWDTRWEDVAAGENADRWEESALDEYSVADVMTRTLCALPPDADAREAAEYMLRASVHRILVLEDDELVGIVTTTDLVKAVAQHGLAG